MEKKKTRAREIVVVLNQSNTIEVVYLTNTIAKAKAVFLRDFPDILKEELELFSFTLASLEEVEEQPEVPVEVRVLELLEATLEELKTTTNLEIVISNTTSNLEALLKTLRKNKVDYIVYSRL